MNTITFVPCIGMASNNIEKIIENTPTEVQNESNPTNKHYLITFTMITLNLKQCFEPSYFHNGHKTKTLSVFINKLTYKTLNKPFYITSKSQISLRKYLDELLKTYQDILSDYRHKIKDELNSLAEKLKHNDHNDMKIFREHLDIIKNINCSDTLISNIVKEITEFNFMPDDTNIFKIFQQEICTNPYTLYYPKHTSFTTNTQPSLAPDMLSENTIEKDHHVKQSIKRIKLGN